MLIKYISIKKGNFEYFILNQLHSKYKQSNMYSFEWMCQYSSFDELPGNNTNIFKLTQMDIDRLVCA